MLNAVSPGFFRAMGVPVLLGREFDEHDDRVEPRPEKPEGWPFTVAVVNETFVQRFFGGQNPIGRHLGLGKRSRDAHAGEDRRRRKGHALRRRP